MLDRCISRGHAQQGARLRLALNCAHQAVVDSWFAVFCHDDEDAQAVCGWRGPGPYAILDSQFEQSGENVMLGGGDPTLDGLMP